MTDANLRAGAWSPRHLLTTGILVAVAFMGGFLWQWVQARDARSERDELRTELAFEQLGNQLASAVIQADGGAYESARGGMSTFFTGLQGEVEAAPTDAQQQLRDILDRRDAVITALSRADPASEELLSRLFVRYQVAMGGPDLGIPIPAPRATDGTADSTAVPDSLSGTP